MKSNNSTALPADQVAAVRGFNRFYTRKFGILAPKLSRSAWSLQEARLIYEIGERKTCTATDLVRALDLDPGYVSRTLKSLERDDILTRKATRADRRAADITLTVKGRAVFADLEARSREDVAHLLDSLSIEDRDAIVGAMSTIAHRLEPGETKPAAFRLRSHRPGDVGWVVSRHAAIYTQEYGWDISFEALVAEIGAQFIKEFDATREHCWIAEVEGERAGSIFLVNGGDGVGKLRLLLVDRNARGLGVGRALVAECIRFAREVGYGKIKLWTQSNLVAARGIYQAAGFVRTAEEPHHSFGVDLVGETWELAL